MIDRATLVAERPVLSYREIARKWGVTVGRVAAAVRDQNKPVAAKPGGRDSAVDGEILGLMSDGRERTTPEIARQLNRDHCGVWRRLHVLERAGVMVKVKGHHGDMPAIWQEAPE